MISASYRTLFYFIFGKHPTSLLASKYVSFSLWSRLFNNISDFQMRNEGKYSWSYVFSMILSARLPSPILIFIIRLSICLYSTLPILSLNYGNTIKRYKGISTSSSLGSSFCYKRNAKNFLKIALGTRLEFLSFSEIHVFLNQLDYTKEFEISN